jgi:hypothetical protein
MTTIRTLILFPASMAVVLGLVGCSGGSGPAAPDIDPNTPPPASTPGVPPAGGASKNVQTGPAPAGLE